MKRIILAAIVLLVSFPVQAQIVSHPSGCPWRAFCGCGVSVRVFGHPVRNLYLASNWFRFPRANPGPGMVAVRNHHVMLIERLDANGNAVVYDPNSGGHQTRIHTRSLRGYHVVNPHGGDSTQVAGRTHRERHRQARQRSPRPSMEAYASPQYWRSVSY